MRPALNVLVVVAHPDDEVLGCGATGAALVAAGHNVRACFMSGDAAARGGRPQAAELAADTLAARAALGFGELVFGQFRAIEAT